jgi:hypothetical protein
MSAFIILFVATVCRATPDGAPEVQLQRDDAVGRLTVLIDGREMLAYQYASSHDMPYYWPLRSPSGKLLSVEQAEPYPHHRSLWIADHVQAEAGPAVDFYHSWKNYRIAKQADSGYRHCIRHQRFGTVRAQGQRARVESELQWMVDATQPVLNEHRKLHVTALGEGEYFLDLEWQLSPTSAAVTFQSDQVHYAWPYLRVHPQFNGEHGGTLVNDTGQIGQAETDGKIARWIDYSNTVDGQTEGVALMVYPEQQPRKWLTRAYGTFGPRRPDAFSGTRFMLRGGERLSGRVGILCHRGDANSGRVAQRYQQFIEGRP